MDIMEGKELQKCEEYTMDWELERGINGGK